MIERSIFAFNGGAMGTPAPTLACCNLFGNTNGDWVGSISDQRDLRGNFSADPIFCDLQAGTLTLNAASPCAPGNSPDECALVGALPVACGAVAVEPQTWGRLKALFR